jgi:hypothetical protein
LERGSGASQGGSGQRREENPREADLPEDGGELGVRGASDERRKKRRRPGSHGADRQRPEHRRGEQQRQEEDDAE